MRSTTWRVEETPDPGTCRRSIVPAFHEESDIISTSTDFAVPVFEDDSRYSVIPSMKRISVCATMMALSINNNSSLFNTQHSVFRLRNGYV